MATVPILLAAACSSIPMPIAFEPTTVRISKDGCAIQPLGRGVDCKWAITAGGQRMDLAAEVVPAVDYTRQSLRFGAGLPPFMFGDSVREYGVHPRIRCQEFRSGLIEDDAACFEEDPASTQIDGYTTFYVQRTTLFTTFQLDEQTIFSGRVQPSHPLCFPLVEERLHACAVIPFVEENVALLLTRNILELELVLRAIVENVSAWDIPTYDQHEWYSPNWVAVAAFAAGCVVLAACIGCVVYARRHRVRCRRLWSRK